MLFQGLSPNNPAINTDPVVRLAGVYQYFRVKNCEVKFVPILGMTQNAIVTQGFLYEAEAIVNFLSESDPERRDQITNNGTVNTKSVFSNPTCKYQQGSTSGRRWWRTDNNSDFNVPAYEQLFPCEWVCMVQSSVTDTTIGYIEFTITYEFKDLFLRSLEDATLLKRVSPGGWENWPPGRGPDDKPNTPPVPPPKPPSKPPTLEEALSVIRNQ